jgi:sporulation protein YlmC with PRC-barrel domain
MFPTRDEVADWKGLDVYSRDGAKVGEVDDIYLDAASGQAEWLAVKGGLFGTRTRLVPMADARLDSQGVIVRETEDVIKDAPDVALDAEVSTETERELYDYYDLAYEATPGRRFEVL